MKIIHSADWHLREKDIEECSRCLDHLVNTAREEKPDLIVIAGDIFHSQEIKLDSQSARLAVKTVSTLANIAPVAVVLGTPSHDGRAPLVLSFARGMHDIRVASEPEQLYLSEGYLYSSLVGNKKPGAILTMIPQPTKQYFKSDSGIAGTDQEISQALTGLFAGFGIKAEPYKSVPHILIGHWNVSGARLSSGQVMTGRDVEVNLDQMIMTGADLHLLGHIHAQQKLGDRTYYAGSLYHENWGEQEAKGFLIFDHVGEYEDDPRFVEVPCKRLARFVFDMTAGESINVPAEQVAGAIVRIDVSAWQDETGLIDKDQITTRMKLWGAEVVDIRITPVPRVTVRAEAVLKADALRDKISRRAELVGDVIEEEKLQLADILEVTPSEQLVAGVRDGHLETTFGADPGAWAGNGGVA